MIALGRDNRAARNMPLAGPMALPVRARALAALALGVLFAPHTAYAQLQTQARPSWLDLDALDAVPLDARLLGGGTITAALVLVILLLALVLLSRRRRLTGLLASERSGAAAMRSRLDHLETLLDAPGQVSIIWDDAGPAVLGRLADLPGVPAKAGDLVAFDRWLEPQSADAAARHVQALREQGARFAMPATSIEGARLVMEGRAAGALSLVAIRPAEAAAPAAEAGPVDKALSAMGAPGDDDEAMRAMLDFLPAPAWIRDAQGRLQWVNEAYAMAAGAVDRQMVLSQERELFDTPTRDALHSLLGANGGRYSGDLVAEGSRDAYNVTVLSMPSGSAGIARPITQLRGEQDLLSRQLDAQARTLNQVRTAIAIFGPDRRLQFFNTAYAELWELDPEWLEGGPIDGQILDMLRDAGRLPEQADYRSWKKKLLAEHASQRERFWHLPNERTIQVLAEPHPGGGASFFYQDVTEKLKLESERNAIDQERRQTLDNLSEGVALFSADGVLRLYNPAFARLWRLNGEDLKKEPRIDQVIAWARLVMDKPELWSRLRAAVTAMGEERAWDSIRFDRPDGSVIDSAMVPLPGGGTLITFIDITDSARAERALRERNEALEAADRVKNAFIHHVSYVLRAPLTTIIGYADLLSRESAGPQTGKQREFTGHLLTSSHSLLAIINDILDLATIDAGVMDLQLAPVEIGQVMQAAALGVRDRLQEADITLDITDPGDVGTFIADDKRLKQVLFNLLANAVSYSPPRGRVSLRAERQDDTILFTVEDQGKGIAPEIQENIFKPFESYSPAGGHRGPGLGLSIVRALVELHGGDVRLRSTPGKGTVVICAFPVTPARAGVVPGHARALIGTGNAAAREPGGS